MEQEVTARELSVEILTDFDVKGRLETFRLDELDGRNRQQAKEYIQGILRRKSYLDFLIDHYSNLAFDKIDVRLVNVLRLGIYDFLFMDGTKDHAAVNEAVEIAKFFVNPQSGDMVNGILRNLQREAKTLPKPAFKDRTKLIAVTFSHPEWMVERWVKRFGEREAFQLMQANNHRPDFYIRVNNLKTQTEYFVKRLEKSSVQFEESDWLPGFFKVSSLNEVYHKGWITKGLCQVQDIAAGFAPWILDVQEGESVVDLCAAPGTKTIFMSDLMQNTGSILAVDINPERIELIAQNAETFGAENVKIQRADAANDRFKLADAVLLDAPCTGTGVLAKRADLRWRRTPEELTHILKTQEELLDAAGNMVNKNGRLVYSTCSIEPEENMGQVKKFLETYDNFELEDLSGFLPEEVLIEDGKAYQTYPHKHHCDGHFGVLLRRKF